MEIERRRFVKAVLSTASVAAAWMAGLVPRAWAAWPKPAFDAQKTQETLEALYGSATLEPSSDIDITAPEIAENGTVVPVAVRVNLPGVDSIALIAEENPRPLVATAAVGKRMVPSLTTRIKLAKTQNILAVARANGKLYSATRKVKVTIGGCGG